MNKLLLSTLSLLLVAGAQAAGPVVEPGLSGVKLDLARPEAVLPGAPAAAGVEGLAAPVSAVPGVEAAASAAPEAGATAAPSQNVDGDRAQLDAEFDGSAAHGGDDAGLLAPVDFSQAVSEKHRGLLLEALAAHADSVAAFFDLTGQPRPGFLYVSHARDDSPGEATVVKRVIYSMSGHSSRFDERVASLFWVGVDLSTKKIEFFTKEPNGAAPQPQVSDATRAKIVEAFEHAKGGAFGKMQWSRTMPVGVRFVRVPLGGDHFADGYQFDALVPAGPLVPGAHGDPNAAEYFIIERSGGQDGHPSFSKPIPLTSKTEQGWPEHIVAASKRLSDHYLPLVGKSKVIGVGHSADHVVVMVRDQADVAEVKADVETRFPDVAGLVEYLVTGDIAPQRGATASIPVPDTRLKVLISPETADAVKQRFAHLHGHGVVDALPWNGSEPAIGEHATVALSNHLPGSGDEYVYAALVPTGQDSVFYLRRSGGFGGGTVYAGPLAVSLQSVQAKVTAVFAEEDAALAKRLSTGIGGLKVFVRARDTQDRDAAATIVAARMPEFAPLLQLQVVTGRIVAQADADGQAKTPSGLVPGWFGAPRIAAARFEGAGHLVVDIEDEHGSRLTIESPANREVFFAAAPANGMGQFHAVNGTEAFELHGLLGRLLGQTILADSARGAVVAMRNRLQRVFTGTSNSEVSRMGR